MTVIVAVETVVLALLCVLVAGLLRSHAAILRRLHDLDTRPRAESGPNMMPGLAEPAPLNEPFVSARDIEGQTLDGETVVIRTAGVDGSTVLAFLSSTCATCENFWDDFARPDFRLPESTRLVIVVKDASEESPSTLAQRRPPGIDVVMSSAAWTDFRVPGSPYVISVDGATGRTTGEGTGMGWKQVSRMLAEATGDAGYVADLSTRRHKPAGDVEREARVDRELLRAGILPGDPSLYPDRSQGEPEGSGP